MREDRLSRFQQGALLWCAMVSPMIRQAPGAAAAAAGRGAWVSAVFALPLGAVLGLGLTLVERLFHSNRNRTAVGRLQKVVR